MIILSVLLSLLFLLAYYAVCASAFAVGGAGRILSALRRDKRCLLIVLLLLLGGTAGAAYLIWQDRFVYYWDFTGYWELCLNQTKAMFSEPAHALEQLAASLNQDDYTLLLPTIIALPLKILGPLFGNSHNIYVLTNHLVFMIPATLGVALCAVKFLNILFPGERAGAGPRFVLGAAVAVLFPAFYYAMLHGYIDAGLLLPVSAVIFLLLDYDLTAPFTVKSQWRDLLLSLLLILTCLCRRYAAYFVVGIAVAMICLAVMELAACRKARPVGGGDAASPCPPDAAGGYALRRGLLSAAAHLAYIGAVSLLILLVFFRTFFLHALTTDFSSAYAAYNDTFVNKILLAGESFGVCAVLSVLTVCLYALCARRGRRSVAALLIQVAVTALAFFSVQFMDFHHRYIIAVPLCLFTTAALFLLVAKASRGVALLYRRVLPALCCLTFVCNWLYAYVPAVRGPLAPVSSLLCDAYQPLRRGDIDQLHAMRDFLAEKTAEDGTVVYLLASGYVLNNDILRCLDLPESSYSLPTLLPVNNVDLRDGFPVYFLTAELVLTTDPIQTHLPEGTQEIVRFLAQEVRDPDSPVGRHYRQCQETFPLDQGVTAYIYERVSPWEQADIDYIKSYFTSLYPDHPELFADRIAMPAYDTLA